MRIHKIVVDYAMKSRVKPSDNGVMVGESESWKHGDQTQFGFGPVVDQTADVGRRGLVLVPESKPI